MGMYDFAVLVSLLRVFHKTFLKIIGCHSDYRDWRPQLVGHAKNELRLHFCERALVPSGQPACRFPEPAPAARYRSEGGCGGGTSPWIGRANWFEIGRAAPKILRSCLSTPERDYRSLVVPGPAIQTENPIL